MNPTQLAEILTLAIISGVLKFEGEPRLIIDGELFQIPDIGKPDTGYRPDGYSIATYHGCRRHQRIDEYIEKLKSQGDRVIDDCLYWHAPRWVAFDPMTLEGFGNPNDYARFSDPGFVHHIESTDPVERTRARRACSLTRVLAFMVGQNPADFPRLEDLDGDGRPDYRQERQHHTLFASGHLARAGADELIERWPEIAINYIDDIIAKVRSGDMTLPDRPE